MSQSPHSSLNQEALTGYRSAWQATMKLLRQGRSFSGNERNCVFLNTRDGKFANASMVSGLDFSDDARAVGLTDWDQDGDLDIWFHNRTGPRLRIMLNQTRAGNSNNQSSHPPASDASNFVAIRLQGTKSNRDAIGTRVEVVLAQDHSPKLIQTLRAGDAFLSQSSKRLHFGLGQHENISQVIATWPNGTRESFSNIQANADYLLVEGSGVTKRLPSRALTNPIECDQQASPQKPQTARLKPSAPFPMPWLTYTESKNPSEPKAITTNRRPLLVIFWASWCPTCLKELEEIKKRKTDFDSENLNILALSIDACDIQNEARSEKAAVAVLEHIEFPDPSHFATDETLDKLRLIQPMLYNQELDFVVPTSYLFNENGDLVSVYRGRIDFGDLVDDARTSRSTKSDHRDSATDFRGRWLSPAKLLLPRAVGQIFKDAGFMDDYQRYMELDKKYMQLRILQAKSPEHKQQLWEEYANQTVRQGLEILASNNVAEAEELFKQALDFYPQHVKSPEYVQALVNLGVISAKRKDTRIAIERFRAAVEADADFLPARRNLALSLFDSKQYRAAEPHFRYLLERGNLQNELLGKMAKVLLEAQKTDEALTFLQKAIESQPDDFISTLRLAWLFATHKNQELRDGTQAVKLADQLVKISQGKDIRALDVQAAAHAENGNFEEAQKILSELISQLTSKQQGLKPLLNKRLGNYANGIPYRDDDGIYP